MDIVAIRRLRLRHLIDSKYAGSQAAFVDATGINQGELSGLLRKKSFGEKKARALEAAAGLESMYLDRIDYLKEAQSPYQGIDKTPSQELTREEEYLLTLIKNMRPEARNALLKVASVLPKDEKRVGGRRIGGERRQRENTIKEERRQNLKTYKGGQ